MKEEDVTAANCYAVRRMPLMHSDEIQWDPRDFPRGEPRTPRMMTRDYLAWVAVIIMVGTGILLNL